MRAPHEARRPTATEIRADAPNHTPQIPGWDRATWAVRGVKGGGEWIWELEASVDVTCIDGGVEDTFAPKLVRTDQVTTDATDAAVHVGETVIHFTDDAYIRPSEARRLAAALVGAGRLCREPPMTSGETGAPGRVVLTPTHT